MNAGTTVLTSPSASVLTLADGSSSAPALANTGDTNTGIFFPAADTVGVAVGGTEVWRFGSNPTTAKNLIINGAMTVAQRGTSFTSVGASNAEYLLDRYYLRLRSGAPARWTVTQESSGGVSGTAKWMKILCTTADTTLAGGDGQAIQQSIEGFNCQPIVGSNGKVAAHAISFDVIGHADAGSSITFPAKFCVGVKTQDGTGRQYHHDVTIAAADTWERVSFVVPADGTATLDNDNGDAYRLTFGLYSQQQATADTWENGDADHYVTSATDNWADSTNNYIGFTHVQVEPGSVATDFEHEDYGTTLAKCQRYLYNVTAANGDYVCMGVVNSSTATLNLLPLPVEMRATPTLEVSNVTHFGCAEIGVATRATIGLSLDSASHAQLAMLSATVSSSGMAQGEATVLTFNNASATMALTAEL